MICLIMVEILHAMDISHDHKWPQVDIIGYLWNESKWLMEIKIYYDGIYMDPSKMKLDNPVANIEMSDNHVMFKNKNNKNILF